MKRHAERSNYQDAKRSRISFKRVTDLINKEPDTIILELSEENFSIDDYMQASSMGHELIKLLLKLFDKAFRCYSLSNKKLKLVEKLAQSKFLKVLVYNKIEDLIHDPETLKSLINIISYVLKTNPSALINIQNIIDRIELVVKIRLRDANLSKEFDEKIEATRNEINDRKNFKVEIRDNRMDDIEPTEKIINLSIVPKLEELCCAEKPFLRPNIVYGPFRSVEQYLDINFRLLREDFLQPLRKGLQEFKAIIAELKIKIPNITASSIQTSEMYKKLSNIEALRVYTNVTISPNSYGELGTNIKLQLDKEKVKNIKWEFSKRLLYGSLVCLSSDFFENEFILAIVYNRDTDQIKNGLVSVQIYDEDHINTKDLISEGKTYVILETTAYFEAYKHILKALRSFSDENEDEFPLKAHLIDCKNSNMEAPNYLKNSKINFQPLLNLDDQEDDYGKACRIDLEHEWPSAQEMNLDSSQYEAIKLTLTNKISLIQGPPGTGKTFIGVKILQLLLHNNMLWSQRNSHRKSPILMICYTNHALDQFLELCIQECNLTRNVVRIGGRCKNPKLENFLLKKIKENIRQNRKLDKTIFYQTKDGKSKLNDIENSIQNKMEKIRACEKGIVSLAYLMNHMKPEHKNELSTEKDLLIWLGFQSAYMYMPEYMNCAQLDEKRNEIFNDDTDIYSDGTDDENDERMLDDEDYDPNIPILIDEEGNNEKIIIHSEKEIIEEFAEFNYDAHTLDKSKKAIKNHINKILNCKMFNYFDTPSIWALEYEERILLYKYWVHDFLTKLKNEIKELKQQSCDYLNTLDELRLQEDRMVMQDALIIAMTTNGSAKYHEILKDIGPKIVIVEEAAEVFEAHIVASLSKHCEHLILIGDHVQLRPKVNVNELARQYHLDVSLFERLLKNRIKHVMLTCQHRMRPEISCLMQHFYKFPIEDHESVKSKPNVLGITSNIFFISHKHFEQDYEDGKSKMNKFEAEYLTQLCKYLLKQQYSGECITILATYMGQMFYIKNLLRTHNIRNVRVSTVDNYQGEENDIILLSLVRSNKEERIGFLSIENRITVACSRARIGFYCIGNFNILSKTSYEKRTKWTAIIESMKNKKCFGEGVTLTCLKHSHNNLLATTPTDFDKRPEGGCRLSCDYRLDCGHKCSYFCHLYDSDHETIACNKNCDKRMICGHICVQKCCHKNSCEYYSCKEKLIKRLPCNHEQIVSCFESPETIKCNSQCVKTLLCGHKCFKRCYERCEPCAQFKEIKSFCKHGQKIKVPCKADNWFNQELCQNKCNTVLECGHLCHSDCGKCFSGRIHCPCTEKCNRILVCGHKCTTPCARQCAPCASRCENRCEHSRCNKICSVPCIPCYEPCGWRCKHKRCTKLCFEICDRDPCTEPCPKKLKCGHKCIGFCGETCPPLCRICNQKAVTEIFFGSEDDPNARFVYLEDCKHVIESEGLSTWLETNYGDQRLSDNTMNTSYIIKLPDCPKCKTPIRCNLRFSKYVKTQLNALEEVKITYMGSKGAISNKKYQFIAFLSNKLYQVENKYTTRARNTLKDIEQKTLNLSLNDYISLENRWMLYFKLIEMEEKNSSLIRELKHKSCLDYETNKIKTILLGYKKVKNELLSEQIQIEIVCEITRLSKLYELFKSKENLSLKQHDANIKDGLKILEKLEDILINKPLRFNDVKDEVKRNFEMLKPYLNGLPISEEERIMIVKAIGLKQGHWFKCPNGHVYCIGECGGATQLGTCPDCGSQIGGQNHRRVDNNAIATEMDGATYGAYSEEANNLANFDLNNLH